MMFAQRLRQARNEKKLTQDELAKKVNTKKTTISNYETGYSTPSHEILSDIADVLGKSTDWLLGRNYVAEENSEHRPNIAFFDGGEDWSEEEFEIAKIAAEAAVEAKRRREQQKKKDS